MGGRLDSEGFVHHGVNIAFAGEMLRIDFRGLTGEHVVIYGQTEVQKDLYDALERAGITLIDQAGEVLVEDIEGDSPRVSFEKHGSRHEIRCDFVAGCDGAHGVTP